MTTRSAALVTAPNPDQRRVAQETAERARQVIATGNFDYGISLLTLCCKIDPANIHYRKSLRSAQKEKYDNNLRGSRFAFISVPRHKARVKTARAKRDYLKVLEYAEDVLSRNPWDLGVQMDMAEAFDALGLVDLAIFTLDQARQKHAKDATLNRALARVFEKRGDYKQAIALWQIVAKANPADVEAAHKAKDLAASETIAKGGYVEAAAGTKESPIVGRMEAAAQDKKGDKLVREAEPLLKRIEANPSEPTLYLQLATLYRRQKQDDRARAALQQGLVPTGQHHTLRAELLELDLIPLRVNVERLTTQLQAAKTDPTFDGPSEEELAEARQKAVAEVLAREVALLKLRADNSPTDMAHRLELGVKLLKADRVEEAISELQMARRDEKTKGRAAMYLGACFKKRANWRLAQRNFEEALQLLPASDEPARKEVYFQLATGTAEAGDLARALELGHELANIDYNYKNIGRLLDEWQTRLQQA